MELCTCKTALPIQPIYWKNGPNGLNWQYSLAGSSKTAPRILILLIAMGAKPFFSWNSLLPHFWFQFLTFLMVLSKNLTLQFLSKWFNLNFATLIFTKFYTHYNNAPLFSSSFFFNMWKNCSIFRIL